MIGKIFIDVALVAFLLGLLAQVLSMKSESLKKYFDKFYYAGFGAILLASGFHLYNLLAHNFEYNYVANYSSRELPFFLNLSSFFAGQEGSYLFWALCAVIIGFPLVKKAKKNPLAYSALAFYSLSLIFLTLALVFKTPFHYIWEVTKGVKEGFVPQNGVGLNPVLENVWMAIHPPLLFIGFAFAAVPYSYALAGLFNRDYDSWIIASRNWILGGALFLGVGLALGGVWAYETLGWGGFWGWDPVENSSLIPWLFMVALAHTVIIQKKTGGLKKTNILLAVMTFTTTIYSTFLTRSGVLADFSVHSFPSTEKASYYIILGFLTLFFTLGIGLLIARYKELSAKKAFSALSREYMMTFGVAVLSAFSLFILIGISLPIIGPLFGSNPSLPGQDFYENIGAPAAAVFMVFAALSFVISWRERRLIFVNKIHLIVFAVLSIAGAIISQTDLIHTILLIGSFFSFLLIFSVLGLNYAKYRAKLGPFLSHLGLSILCIGIVYHGAYKQKFPTELAYGESVTQAGKLLTFKGKERIDINLKDREKYLYLFELGEHKQRFNATVYWSNYNKMTAPFFEPAVKSETGVDYYLSPKSIDYKPLQGGVTLKKGATGLLNDSVKIEFTGYDMSQGHSEAMILGAVVKIYVGSKTIDKTLLYEFAPNAKTQSATQWEDIDGTNLSVGFKNFNPDRESMSESTAEFGLAVEKISFDFEKKPCIPLVWAGFVFTLAGFLIAIKTHVDKAKENEKAKDGENLAESTEGKY